MNVLTYLFNKFYLWYHWLYKQEVLQLLGMHFGDTINNSAFIYQNLSKYNSVVR